MRALRLFVSAGCWAAFAGAAFAQEQPQSAAAPPTEMLVFIAEHAPASSIAEAIQRAFPGAGVTVTSEPAANMVLIQAPAGPLGRIKELLPQLDPPPATIALDVVIVRTVAGDQAAAELAGDAEAVEGKLAGLEQAGTVEVLDRLHLTTLDNQTAEVRFGQRVLIARPGGFSGFEGRPREMRPVSSSAEDVGTSVTVIPRRTGVGVVAALKVEKTWIAAAKPSAEGDDLPASPGPATELLSVQGTVRVPSGKAVLLSGNDATIEKTRFRTAVIVTARVAE